MNCSVCAADLPEGSSVCSSCGANLADPSLPTVGARALHVASAKAFNFAPGDSFGGRYTVVEEIGIGGMGCVYKAIDRELVKTVALKLILPEVAARAGAFSRFKRELALAQEVTHPNVSRVYDMGEVQGLRYISMEYVDGQSLRDLIHAVGRLSPRQTVALGRQVCSGLQAIHAESIVHRDLKPSNIVVDRSGRAVLMDFGIAHRGGPGQIGSSEISGTPAYFAPEQAQSGFTDQRSDIYSLGLVLFEMLTGKRAPGDGDSAPLALRPAQQSCPPPSRIAREVPASLDAVVLRCLESDPNRRFQSAGELDTALEQAASTLSTDRMAAAARPPTRRGWFAVALAAAVLLAALAYWGRSSKRAAAPAEPITLACLPLVYDGPAESAYLAQLIPLLVSEDLRAAASLLVAPYSSSRTFGPQEDTLSVASQLGVQWLLRGRIGLRGSQLEGELQLVSSEGTKAWSQSIKSEAKDILSEVDAITSNIAARLGAELGPRSSLVADRDPRALTEYLEGKKYLEGWDVYDPSRAAAAFARAANQDGSFAEADAGLALAQWASYYETRDPTLVDRAARSARRALELNENLPEAHLAWGVIELGRGHSVEARDAFQKAQRAAPADDAVCRWIAKAYQTLGRYQDAERMYRRAIDLRPNYWKNYNDLGSLYYGAGDFEQAERAYRKVIELQPENEVGYTNLAGTLILTGRAPDAVPLLQAAIRINPTADGHTNLGFVYYSSAQYDLAVKEWERAVELAPDSGPELAIAHANLGDAYRQLGRSEEAAAHYARAIELNGELLKINPKDVEARISLAIALAGAGRCGEAAGQASQAIGEQPDSPTYHYYVALVYAVCGDRNQAVDHTILAIEGGAVADVKSSPDLQPLLTVPAIQKLLRDS